MCTVVSFRFSLPSPGPALPMYLKSLLSFWFCTSSVPPSGSCYSNLQGLHRAMEVSAPVSDWPTHLDAIAYLVNSQHTPTWFFSHELFILSPTPCLSVCPCSFCCAQSFWLLPVILVLLSRLCTMNIRWRNSFHWVQHCKILAQYKPK